MNFSTFIALSTIVVSFAEALGGGGGIFPFIALSARVVSFAEALGGGWWKFFCFYCSIRKSHFMC